MRACCAEHVSLLQGKLPQGNFLWELIHPQAGKGQPTTTASGKYHVKCFVMDQWRQVTVDDRIPVDAFGSPLLVGSMPLQLWPLLLSKAVLKLMSLYQVCHDLSSAAAWNTSLMLLLQHYIFNCTCNILSHVVHMPVAARFKGAGCSVLSSTAKLAVIWMHCACAVNVH